MGSAVIESVVRGGKVKSGVPVDYHVQQMRGEMDDIRADPLLYITEL